MKKKKNWMSLTLMVVNERNMSAIDDGSSGLSNIATGQIGINVFASTMHVRHIRSICRVILPIVLQHFHNFKRKNIEIQNKQKFVFFFARKSLFIFSLLLKHICSCHIDNFVHLVLDLPDGNSWRGQIFMCFNDNCSWSLDILSLNYVWC